MCLFVLEENFFAHNLSHSSFYTVTIKLNNKIARDICLTVNKRSKLCKDVIYCITSKLDLALQKFWVVLVQKLLKFWLTGLNY